MVAGAASLCGAWSGTTVPGDEASNPRGFFEHVAIREHVVKRLLLSMGCDPLGVRKLPVEKPQGEIPGLAALLKNIVEHDGYSHDRPWMYKDAKLTLLWPYFQKAFPDAKWLIVNRDLPGFIRSCQRTHFMKQHSTEPAFWEQFAAQYHRRLAALKNSDASVFELSSPEIIGGDFSRLKQTFLQLGLDYREDELRTFISPTFWHGDDSRVSDG